MLKFSSIKGYSSYKFDILFNDDLICANFPDHFTVTVSYFSIPLLLIYLRKYFLSI